MTGVRCTPGRRAGRNEARMIETCGLARGLCSACVWDGWIIWASSAQVDGANEVAVESQGSSNKGITMSGMMFVCSKRAIEANEAKVAG